MFKQFKEDMQAEFELAKENGGILVKLDVSKDTMWNTYLNSFPDEIKKQEHNCNACKSFMNRYGNLAILCDDYSLISIWNFDTTVKGYEKVPENMFNLMKTAEIREIFYDAPHEGEHNKLGTDFNHSLADDGSTVTWHHFYLDVTDCTFEENEDIRKDYINTRNVFERGLDEIRFDAIDTVLDLIVSNSIYRGEEYKQMVMGFYELKKGYRTIRGYYRRNYTWYHTVTKPSTVTKIRSRAIGTLLIDLSEGKSLEDSVRAFEKIMAPENYKRPTAIITKTMIANAEKKVEELGLTDSLARRFADYDDVTVANTIYVDRKHKEAFGVFDELREDITINPHKLKNVQDISEPAFINEILKSSDHIEILLENRLIPNLVSLISPEDKDADSLFKWDNNFAWCYKDSLADSSIKEMVQAAGGKTTGELRVSLAWHNYDDLDLHVFEPNGNRIYYSSKLSYISKGELDVDMNAGGGDTRKPVENIIFPDAKKMLEGKYKIVVHNYRKREENAQGFSIEIECRGEVFNYDFTTNPKHNEYKDIISFDYSRDKGMQLKGIPSVNSKEVWGLNTNQFHKVSMIMDSPNYWDDNMIGNQHLFFILEKAMNDDVNPRGFFNEFLHHDLNTHRKVFEALGHKMKVAPTNKQLSGVGFSVTKRNNFIAKVTTNGKEKLYKVNF